MKIDLLNNIDKKKLKLQFKSRVKDWNTYLSMALIIGAVFVCLIIASLINLYYPKDWMIERTVMDSYVFKAIWAILLGLHVALFFMQQVLFRYRYSKIQYLIFSYAALIYLMLRTFDFNTKRLDIYPIYPDGTLTYLDFSFVLLGVSLVLSVMRDFIPIKQEDKPNTFLEDNPIYKEEDLAQFDNLVKQIEPALFEDRYKSAFSIGIIGPWGSGKSSFIKAVEKRIETENDSQIIYISFSPFLNHNEDRVIHEFFVQLSNELKKRSGKLSNLLLNYSVKLSNAVKDGNPISFLKPSGLTKDNESVGELYDEIDNVIRSLRLKIIVSIDDLDRLNTKEILQVLKLIRNTSNFPNILFLVALDKTYVIKSLEKETELNNVSYLDKFFQQEINIISNSKEELIEYLWTELEKKLKVSKIGSKHQIKQMEEEIKNVKHFHNFINSYRDVKRFINQFVLDYKVVNDVLDNPDVSAIDILYLTIVKIKYPEIFELLRIEDYEAIGIEKVNDFNLLKRKMPVQGEKLIDYLNDLNSVNEFSFDFDNQKIRINKKLYSLELGWLLIKLFGAVKEEYHIGFSDESDRTSIRNNDNLRFYFQKSFPEYVISSTEFNRYYALSVSELKEVLIKSNETNPILFSQIEKRVVDLIPETFEDWTKKLKMQIMFFDYGRNVTNFLVDNIDETITEARLKLGIEFKKILIDFFGKEVKVTESLKRIFLDLKKSLPEISIFKKYIHQEFVHLLEFRLENKLIEYSKKGIHLIKNEKSELVINLIRNHYRDKTYNSDVLELEQLIIKSASKIKGRYKIDKDIVSLFGSLLEMKRSLEFLVLKGTESSLIEYLNIELTIENTSVTYDFNWTNDEEESSCTHVQYFCWFRTDLVFNYLKESDELKELVLSNSGSQDFFIGNNKVYILKLILPKPNYGNNPFMNYIKKINYLLEDGKLITGNKYITDEFGANITANNEVIMSTFSEQNIIYIKNEK